MKRNLAFAVVALSVVGITLLAPLASADDLRVDLPVDAEYLLANDESIAANGGDPKLRPPAKLFIIAKATSDGGRLLEVRAEFKTTYKPATAPGFWIIQEQKDGTRPVVSYGLLFMQYPLIYELPTGGRVTTEYRSYEFSRPLFGYGKNIEERQEFTLQVDYPNGPGNAIPPFEYVYRYTAGSGVVSVQACKNAPSQGGDVTIELVGFYIEPDPLPAAGPTVIELGKKFAGTTIAVTTDGPFFRAKIKVAKSVYGSQVRGAQTANLKPGTSRKISWLGGNLATTFQALAKLKPCS
ncbi:MAG: hypothetical protein KBD16_01910 [Candidatus Pacebacteria bacterium]|nr:hypothetical protein [Candidatus Paceibacterota bacterium]